MSKDTRPLRDQFAALRAAHPLPAQSGKQADKAFFDALSGEGATDGRDETSSTPSTPTPASDR
jgi:hypothetical protein